MWSHLEMAIFQFSLAAYNSFWRVRQCGLFFVHFQSVHRWWPCSARVWADILKDFIGAAYDISRRDDFTANALVLWVSQSIQALFQNNPWALGEGVLCRCLFLVNTYLGPVSNSSCISYCWYWKLWELMQQPLVLWDISLDRKCSTHLPNILNFKEKLWLDH